MAHQIQAPFLYECFYRKALNVPGASMRDKREAAFNLALYHRSVGNDDTANRLMEKYLVI